MPSSTCWTVPSPNSGCATRSPAVNAPRRRPWPPAYLGLHGDRVDPLVLGLTGVAILVCAITAFIGVVALGSVVVLARRWSAATGMA
jgi:hypothetical protein